MALVPPLIGMRGNVFGSLSSKLSTLVATIPRDRLDTLHAIPDVRARYNCALAEVLLLSFLLPAFSAVSRFLLGTFPRAVHLKAPPPAPAHVPFIVLTGEFGWW